jgi:hypothetical protein
MSAYSLQIHWSFSGSNLWHFHDCFIDPNQSKHFGSPVLSNWLCAGTFHGVAKIFVRKQNLEKKLSLVTLPSRQHDRLASDYIFLSKWKEQKSTRGFFNFKQILILFCLNQKHTWTLITFIILLHCFLKYFFWCTPFGYLYYFSF